MFLIYYCDGRGVLMSALYFLHSADYLYCGSSDQGAWLPRQHMPYQLLSGSGKAAGSSGSCGDSAGYIGAAPLLPLQQIKLLTSLLLLLSLTGSDMHHWEARSTTQPHPHCHSGSLQTQSGDTGSQGSCLILYKCFLEGKTHLGQFVMIRHSSCIRAGGLC